jgi:hypothetical protein
MKSNLIKVFLSIILIFCLFDMTYGYYQFVRFTAMIGFAFLAFIANKQNNKNEVFIYIALALLFQPFIKIVLGRTIWNIVDLVVGVGLMFSIFISNEKLKK